MGRKHRVLFSGAFYHAFNRGVNKQTIAWDERDRRTFMQILGESVAEFRVRLFAYCLLDNHFHLFVQTPEPNLDQFMWRLQGDYARYINDRHKRIGPLFQNRYRDRLVNCDVYAMTLTRYIHRNPARHGNFDLAQYPWSSYGCYVGALPVWKWLDINFVWGYFGAATGSLSGGNGSEVLTKARRTDAFKNFVSFHRQVPPEKETAFFDKLTQSRQLRRKTDLLGIKVTPESTGCFSV